MKKYVDDQRFDAVVSGISNDLQAALADKVSATDVPFRFGVDANGNYGYIKDGADTVTPFKTVAKKVGTIICGLNEKTLSLVSMEDRDNVTADNFYLIPTSFTIIDAPVSGEVDGTITFGTYAIRKTYKDYILSVRRDSIPGKVAVDLSCDVYVIY